MVVKAHQAEEAAGGDGVFVATVARQLHHVMAYKDEYEVARLLLAGRSKVAAQFGDDAEMTWNLFPPMLRSMGLRRKLRFGRWSVPMLATLRSMKGLRGTALDPFGHAKVRRTERALVKEYIALVDEASSMLHEQPGQSARAGRPGRSGPWVRGCEAGQRRAVPIGADSSPPELALRPQSVI